MSAHRDHVESIALYRSQQVRREGRVTLTGVASPARLNSDDTALISGDGENVRFIFGVARSGTSWLAKIFDSHPDVLYRHEPDIVLRDRHFPTMCRLDEIDAYRDRARAHLQRLVGIRTLKSAGSLPVFPKYYQSSFARYLRISFVYGLRLAERLIPSAQWPERVQIPDFAKTQYKSTPTIVIKSVSSTGRARLYTEALPASRTIFIFRHPCGQIASMLRGIAQGKFKSAPNAKSLADCAERFGLTAHKIETMPLVEQLAWSWAIMNQKALDDLEGISRSRIVRYEDLCAEPAKIAGDLLEFAGLSWEPQTADFIEKSTHYTGPDRYYKVLKNSVVAANRWRSELSLEDQRRIINIANRVPAGQMFVD